MWANGSSANHGAPEAHETIPLHLVDDQLWGDGRGCQDGQVDVIRHDLHWLRDVNSQSLQMANRNLDTAYRNFFRNPGKTG